MLDEQQRGDDAQQRRGRRATTSGVGGSRGSLLRVGVSPCSRPCWQRTVVCASVCAAPWQPRGKEKGLFPRHREPRLAPHARSHAAAGRGDPGGDDDRHDPGRRRVPARLRAGHQPAGQARRGEPRDPAVRAQGRPLRAGGRGGAGVRADPPGLREDVGPLLGARPAEARRRERARLRRHAVDLPVRRAAGGGAGPPALSRALHRPERAEDRGDGRLPAAGTRRVRRRELPLRASLARLPAARLGGARRRSCPRATGWQRRRGSRCATSPPSR